MRIWHTVPLGMKNSNILTILNFYLDLINHHLICRFGIGRFTTKEEIEYTADKCIRHVQRLREMSPLWEMSQEGIDIKSIQWTQH